MFLPHISQTTTLSLRHLWGDTPPNCALWWEPFQSRWYDGQGLLPVDGCQPSAMDGGIVHRPNPRVSIIVSPGSCLRPFMHNSVGSREWTACTPRVWWRVHGVGKLIDSRLLDGLGRLNRLTMFRHLYSDDRLRCAMLILLNLTLKRLMEEK